MDRRDDETKVWPRAGAEPPDDDEEWSEGPLSLWERLLNFFTVEVPDETEAERPRTAARRVRTPQVEVSDPRGDGGDGEQPEAETAPAETRAWPRVRTPRVEASDPLGDGTDGEQPEAETAPAETRAWPRVRTPRVEASDPLGDGTDGEQPEAETALAETRAWRRVAPPYHPLPDRNLRSRGPRSARASAVRRRRWAAGAVAVAAIAAAVFLVEHAGHHHAPAIVGQAAHPAPHSPARPRPATAPPAAAAKPAPVAQGRSAPDCASMNMQPVPSTGSSTSPSVPGLCFSLHGGSGWLIGCAPGFQAGCDPSLQTVIACVRQVGASHSGVVTEADVRTCDVTVASAAPSGAAGAPVGSASVG